MSVASRVTFKWLMSSQLLVSSIIYASTVGILVWGPVRLIVSMGLAQILLKIPLVENIYYLMEKWFVSIVNTVHQMFFPGSPG
jgi:uncharacterized membrane protein